ncbi:MAG: outer membrane protein assembly factor BamD [Deltaproteobacteria bacterium]|nr:outer membrane protein assembly factor BamD [Deltaproteobacteria bacterium]
MRRHQALTPALMVAGSIACIVLTGCAPPADSQVQADQFALRGMVATDQQQIDSLQEKIQRLNDRVSELEHNGAPSSQITSIEQRLTKLESQSNSAQANTAGIPSGATPNSPTPGEPGAAPGEDVPGAENGAAAATGAEAAASSSSGSASAANGPSWRAMMDQELSTSYDDPATNLYHQGLRDLKENRYPAALGQFQTLQRRYPKSNLSEPAEFFAANSLYEMGKYDQAILQFNDQTMRFPKGRFASAALLREAQAFMKINDRIDARLTLQKLLNDLPDSPEAPMAKSMMQTLAS